MLKKEKRCPPRFLYLETQPPVHDRHVNHLLSTATSTLTLTDEEKAEDRKKCFKDDQIEVCTFDHVDQTPTVGSDVTFMSQDDCVQLNTLQ